MKTRLFALLTYAFVATFALAETYHSVAISDLKFEAPEEEVAIAMEQSVDIYQLERIDARLQTESYLYFGDADEEELPQKQLQLVFKKGEKLPLKGVVDLNMDYIGSMMKTFHFTIPKDKIKEIKEEEFAEARAMTAEGRMIFSLPGGAWWRHQAGHASEDNEGGLDPIEIMDTFSIFSGGRAIADNLALNRDLILGAGKDEEMVRIDTIKGVTVKAIDWSKHLPKGEVPIDPLAYSVPEDQHALFAPSMPGLLKLMNRLESETAPMIGMMSAESSYRGLMKRYRRQLGLDLTDVAARLLPVKSVAVTGGDLYFATGTDVAILMETTKPEALLKALELAVKAQAGIKPERQEDKNLQRLSFVAPEKGISSHLCRIGDLVFVTNSLAQVSRLAEVADKRAPSLGKSEEFKVFRHRYPKADEHAFAFLSDATIRRWAGPVTRIGASRRNRALAALNELTCREISECKMEDDFSDYLGRVAILEGRAISEHYGSAEFLTPISELGLGEVSKFEKQGYEMWRQGYESGWTQVFDPIAVQLKLTDKSMDVDLTVLPLNVNSDMKEVMGIAGEAKLSPRARMRSKDSLLHFACAIDSKGEFFQQFDQQLVSMLPDLKIKPLSWVGESVSIDLIDSLYWECFGNMEFGENIAYLPVVARIEVKSKLKLGLFLTSMRAMMQTSAPDTMNWTNYKHGDRSYVVVSQKDDADFGPQLQICYAIVDKALLVALSERNLKRAMDLEVMKIDDEVIKDLPEAKSMMIDVDPAMFDVIDRIESTYAETSRLARLSWKAIPILNEWRRLYPDRDPVEVHQTLFGTSLGCPGGKGYRWNAEDLTMESAVYGHRGVPREPKVPARGLLKYERMQSGMDFIDDGLRLRMHLGPKAELPALQDPKVGEVIGKGQELSGYKVGRKLMYQNTGDGIEGTWSFIVQSMDKTPKGTRVEYEMPWEEEGDSGTWKGTYLIDAKGIWYLGGEEADFYKSTFEVAPLDLPLELRTNAVHRRDYHGKDLYEEDEEMPDELTRGRLELRVIGTETIQTKAGKFKDCVVVERYDENITGEFFYASNGKEWYHPGTGLVKSLDQTGVSELIKIEEPK